MKNSKKKKEHIDASSLLLESSSSDEDFSGFSSNGDKLEIINKSCPCKTRHDNATWLKCSNKACKTMWWHGSCIGFKANQTILDEIAQHWLCPYCAISNLPSTSSTNINMTNECVYKKLSAELDNLKVELKQELTKSKEKLTKNISSYADIVKQTNQRNDTIASKSLEQNTETKEVIKTLEGNLSNLQKNIETKINEELETKIRKAKELNVCIFNISDTGNLDIKEQLKDDISKLKKVFHNKITLKKEDIKDICRKGQIKSDKPRPIIMKLSSLEIRSKLLSLRDLVLTSENKQDVKVYISPDRTRQQQLQHKKLIEERNALKAQGKNVYIKNGKIVETSLPFRPSPQMFWGE